MSCNIFKGKCNCCKHLAIVTSATIKNNQLILQVPEKSYVNGEMVCFLIAQNLPISYEPIPVIVKVGETNEYFLFNRNGNYIYSDQIRSRQIYSTQYRTDTKAFKYCGYRRLQNTRFVFGTMY